MWLGACGERIATVCERPARPMGKEVGHDVDYILTTPEVGSEEGLLLRVIDRLNYQGILLYTEYQESTFDGNRMPCRRFEAMDRYPKCFLIIQLNAEAVQDGALSCDQDDRRGWRAVRLDLVAPPADRFAYTLLGWSGSTQFERDLRRFARLERGMLLDNHALYDKSKLRSHCCDCRKLCPYEMSFVLCLAQPLQMSPLHPCNPPHTFVKRGL
ncbi:hypothetical protein AALO_G00233360 [Alosa alosa]|uniref:DNA-directed DNA polymerase X domain-containing protein n=1 Tax=Alosa alosa TaxID=278164 RepID=A0AAV6FZ48_9TELE|nr:hypothetical protein AALO_G00233360 [Alosa alosa]